MQLEVHFFAVIQFLLIKH